METMKHDHACRACELHTLEVAHQIHICLVHAYCNSMNQYSLKDRFHGLPRVDNLLEGCDTIYTSFFMVVDSFAAAQALFINKIKEESSSFPLARLLIFSHATSTEGEFRMSSNFCCAVSNVSTISSVLSKAETADKHLAPSLAPAAQPNDTIESARLL